MQIRGILHVQVQKNIRIINLLLILYSINYQLVNSNLTSGYIHVIVDKHTTLIFQWSTAYDRTSTWNDTYSHLQYCIVYMLFYFILFFFLFFIYLFFILWRILNDWGEKEKRHELVRRVGHAIRWFGNRGNLPVK